jgi:hypothetical protein
MTKGQNLKLKGRATAKESQEGCPQRYKWRRISKSKVVRQTSIYQQLRGLREPQIDRKPVTSEVVTQAQLRTAAELQAAVWLAEKTAREEVQGLELRIRGGATVEPDHPAKVGKR